MWNFDAKKIIDGFKKDLQLVIDTHNSQNERLKNLEIENTNLKILLEKYSEVPKDFQSRLEKVETWKAQLHMLMIEKTPGNREKLSRFGKYLKEDFK